MNRLRQTEVPYEEIQTAMIKELSKLGSPGLYQRAVLATSKNDNVTARRMRMIPDGLTLYCWTARNSRKHRQISANPKVAAVIGFVQVDGVASLRKHPKDEVEFLELYKKHLPKAYETSMSHWHNVDYQLIEIQPTRISMYYNKGSVAESYLDVLNVADKKAYRMFDMSSVQEDKSDAPAYTE